MRCPIRRAAVLIPAVLGCAIALSLVARLRESSPSPVGVKLQEADAPVLARLCAKQRMTEALIAGRLTLVEAAADFKSLDADGPPSPDWVMPERPQGMSEAEFYCRMVIDWVKAEAPPDRVNDLVRRLRGELEAKLRDGTLRLPEPAPSLDAPAGP